MMAAWLARRFLRGTDTMLGKVRSLFLGVLLLWPLFSFWSLGSWTAVLVSVLLAGWCYVGYRRQRFPAWSWAMEGAFVLVVLAESDFGASVGLLLVWVNFRALYGPTRQKIVAAAVLFLVLATGVAAYHLHPGVATSLLLNGLTTIAVIHLLAGHSRSRDRWAAREGTLAAAGGGLVASTTRSEAMKVTLDAALAIDRAARAAVIFTIRGPALHVVASAGRVGRGSAGRVAELSAIPERARNTLRPGGYVLLTGDDAAAICSALTVPGHDVVAVAPMAAHGDVFGMLVVALDRLPADHLAAALTTLADEAALTLDHLLSRSRLSIVVEHSADALILTGETGSIRFVNPAAATVLDCPGDDLLGGSLWSLVHEDDVTLLRDAAVASGPHAAVPCRIRGAQDGRWADVEATIEYVTEHDGSRSMVFTARDVSERHRLELELRHAQKLESVGRLAAGIAHEINTPIQFIGDNVRFLDTAFTDLARLCEAYDALVTTIEEKGDVAAAVATVREVAADVDVEFVMEEVPTAIGQTLDGVGRVAHIVRAMKAFGHPGTEEKNPVDLNTAIETTLTVASNEIKYVADVETAFGELPPVHCHHGDINQVILNLVVNAAHAIGSADRGRGTITVSTRLDGDYAVIDVADTGTGVPPEIADKLFEPFFTTKEVGTGTGQGLALVRTLVTDRHGGTIDFTSEMGAGTVFTVRLPTSPELVGAAQ